MTFNQLKTLGFNPIHIIGNFYLVRLFSISRFKLSPYLVLRIKFKN